MVNASPASHPPAIESIGRALEWGGVGPANPTCGANANHAAYIALVRTKAVDQDSNRRNVKTYEKRKS